jgi:hypothetical protein
MVGRSGGATESFFAARNFSRLEERVFSILSAINAPHPAYPNNMHKPPRSPPLKPGGWQGPIQSGYGWHLVFVDTIEPGRVPAFEEIEPDVKSAWLDQKQREIKRLAFEAIRARYTVVVPPIESVDLGNLRELRAPMASMNLFPQ